MLGNSVDKEKVDCTNEGVGSLAFATLRWGFLMRLVKISIVDNLVGSMI